MTNRCSRSRFIAHRLHLVVQADTPRLEKSFDALFGGYFPFVPLASTPAADAFSLVATTVTAPVAFCT